MNSEIKKLWVDALRSGKYKQGQGLLKAHINGESVYCCLGVLSDLAFHAKGCEIEVKESLAGPFTVYLFDNCNHYLSQKVCDWAELLEPNPVVNDAPLSYLNDTGTPFNEIADIIELHL